MKQKFLQKTVCTILMLIAVVFVYSQGGPPPPPPPPAPQAGVPIDGAVLLLLGTGLVYGARKLYKEQQSSELN